MHSTTFAIQEHKQPYCPCKKTVSRPYNLALTIDNLNRLSLPLSLLLVAICWNLPVGSPT